MRITRVGPGVVSAVALVAAGLAGAGVATAAPQAPAQDDKVQIVTVHASTQKERSAVDALGLDTTEHADEHGVDVVLHGAADVARLRASGKRWTVKVADLAAVERANAAKDKAYAASVAESQLPSGRTGYRHLADYNAEMAPWPRSTHQGQVPHAAQHLGPRQAGPRHRDHQRRGQHQGRQARLPHHGRPPRARVAVLRARDGVRLRPARGR